jgi:hypothetical protein
MLRTVEGLEYSKKCGGLGSQKLAGNNHSVKKKNIQSAV